jgi:ATP-dependent Clp protease adaptor protein ClpS
MSEVKTKPVTKTEVTEPPYFRVVYCNDSVTTVEFVVESLVKFFDYSYEMSEKITHEIHNNGSATVAVLPFEIAEQKGIEVTLYARRNGYPLQVKIEKDLN